MPDKNSEQIITIILVDDTADTRENVKKLLSFERDFQVVGMAGTGTEGVALAKELRPDIVIMDINMPDMDGIQATTLIMNSAPYTGIIIMSAQDDPQYMRGAMLAGAKAYITKPSSPDNLYGTIRSVYKRAATILPPQPVAPINQPKDKGSRAGNIIVVYSPQGGAGCTTVATNLASELTRDGIRVLLVDANLQFGDVGVFLNLQAKSTIVDLVDSIDDLDTDFFENIIVTHGSGLKVLLGPPRPEQAEKISSNPTSVTNLLSKVRQNYDFIVVDTSLNLDEVTLSLLDMATRIIMVSVATLPAIKNTRYVLDLFDQLSYPSNKVMLVINRFWVESNMRKLAISAERIASFLNRPVDATIPLDEFAMLDAVRKGLPVVASQRDRNHPIVKELVKLAETLLAALIEPDRKADQSAEAVKPAGKKPTTSRWG